jgi:hypothetical protein
MQTSQATGFCHVMSRRADPERINELAAEHRIVAWEREAERQGLDRLTAAFWEAGDRWIAAQRWG